MTYATEIDRVGRHPLTVVEIDLDACSLTFGTPPCTASAAAGSECYNTLKTCLDVTNYTKTTKTYRFCEMAEGLPAGVDMIPSVLSVSRAPTRIVNDFGLGHRASVTITLQDHAHHDRGIDPYLTTRTYDPEAQGTFWGRLRARTPYYQGRTLRIRSGYLADPFAWTDFEDRDYIIEEIRGPDAAGVVQVIAKDILKLADDARAVCPLPSEGELFADITISETSMSIVGGTYDATGWVRIADEIIEYTGKSGAGTAASPWVLTGLVRTDITWNTTASAHKADDAVQQCKVWQAVNVRDILDELLTTYAGIAAAFIDATQWDDEESQWLSAYSLTANISTPTGVATLVAELQEQCSLRVWYDEVANTIPLKSLTPPVGNVPTTLTDTANILKNSLKIKDLTKDRISQVWIYYALDNYTSSEVKNYRRLLVSADTGAEGVNQYGDQRIHKITSRWFNNANASAVAQTAGRIIANRRDAPREVMFALDAKDSAGTWTGDVRDIQAADIQGVDGAADSARILITEAREVQGGHRYEYKGITGIGESRFGFIGANTLGNYTAESEANQQAYGFISATGPPKIMSNGDTGYKVI